MEDVVFISNKGKNNRYDVRNNISNQIINMAIFCENMKNQQINQAGQSTIKSIGNKTTVFNE